MPVGTGGPLLRYEEHGAHAVPDRVKMFTAVGVLRLVAQGKMSLDRTTAHYLPAYPQQELAKKVRIRHLLSHTGGTGDIFGLGSISTGRS